MKYPLKRKPQAPGSRFPKRRHANYRAFIVSHDCIVRTHARYPTACYAMPDRYKIEFCHYKTQGSGGDDIGNTFSACPGHHTEQEGKDAEFEAKYGLVLADICAEFRREWETNQGEVTE